MSNTPISESGRRTKRSPASKLARNSAAKKTSARRREDAPDLSVNIQKTKEAVSRLRKEGRIKIAKSGDIYVLDKIEYLDIDNISKKEKFIGRDDNRGKYQAIQSLVATGLESAFDKAGLPSAKRDEFVSSVTNALLSQSLNVEAHAAPVMPTKAPEIYQGLRGPETPPEFVQRVYGLWLGQGLTRAHIRKLDPKLYTAIENWSRKPDNAWPADIDLPTLKQQNDRDIAHLAASDDREVLGKFTGKEAARLGAAIARRTQ